MIVTSDIPEVDTGAVAHAAWQLGIKSDVHILAAFAWNALGYYKGVREGIHEIAVCNLRDLSATLWHELTHALQCERDWNMDSEAARDSLIARLKELDLYDVPLCTQEQVDLYNSMPEEVEARANEALAVEYPLAREREPVSLLSDSLFKQMEAQITERIMSDILGLDNLPTSV